MSGGQQASKPAEVVPEEPRLLPRRGACEEDPGMAPGAPRVLARAGRGAGEADVRCELAPGLKPLEKEIRTWTQEGNGRY